MALSFTKPASKQPSEAAPPAQQASPKTSGLSFMKKGEAAKVAFAQEEAKAEMAKSAQNRLWRFRMKPETDTKITFLDGNLDESGMLDIGMFYEHTVQLNGEWKSFVCTEDSEGVCPLCEQDRKTRSFVGILTVIDHSEHKIKSGPNAGKVISNTKRLFVAKKETIKVLTKIAVKRGGLTGCTFDVSRGGEKTPAVGSQFDFTEKNSLEDIASALDLKLEDVMPADYEKEITYYTAEQLSEMGVGKKPAGPGFSGSINKSKLTDEL